MAQPDIPANIDPKTVDPQFQYGPNAPGAPDSLALSLPNRSSYERACAAFGVTPKSDEELMQMAEVFSGPDFLPEQWTALGRDGRVSYRLDHIYYFALKAQRADAAWRAENPGEEGQTADARSALQSGTAPKS
jgi:hypothetical protein